jgi:hypothetical protein
VCPIQCNFLSFIWVSIGFWFVLFHNSSSDITSGHLKFIIRHRQWSVEICNWWVIILVTFQVSQA